MLSNSCFCMSTYELTKIRPSFQKLKLSIKVALPIFFNRQRNHNYLEIFYIVTCLWKTNHRMLNQMFFEINFVWQKSTFGWLCKSMTSLLTHTVAHSKINHQPLKKFLSLAVRWVKVVKNGQILTFKVNFLCQKLSESF